MEKRLVNAKNNYWKTFKNSLGPNKVYHLNHITNFSSHNACFDNFKVLFTRKRTNPWNSLVNQPVNIRGSSLLIYLLILFRNTPMEWYSPKIYANRSEGFGERSIPNISPFFFYLIENQSFAKNSFPSIVYKHIFSDELTFHKCNSKIFPNNITSKLHIFIHNTILLSRLISDLA